MIRSELPPLRFAGRSVLPVVQGGMGIGISAGRLAGAVASEGAFGTIAAADLRHLHPDLVERTRRSRDEALLTATNLEALDREVKLARERAGGRGVVAVNVMKAVTTHSSLVRQAAESGADAVVMGAGLPLDLPDLLVDHPKVALVPILSDLRGIALVLRKWLRRDRIPAAIIIEHPRFAGGHLGASKIEEVGDARFDFAEVLGKARELFRELGIEKEGIPLVPAGGVNTFEKVQALLGLGADAVQVGTPFAVTEEGDAHPEFKRVLASAEPESIVTFMSVAGLPARAVLTPWLGSYLEKETELRARADAERSRCPSELNCLSRCGLRDGVGRMGQFCIDSRLVSAFRGDVENGLFFRGSESLPFGDRIRPVRELLEYLLTGLRPAADPAGA